MPPPRLQACLHTCWHPTTSSTAASCLHCSHTRRCKQLLDQNQSQNQDKLHLGGDCLPALLHVNANFRQPTAGVTAPSKGAKLGEAAAPPPDYDTAKECGGVAGERPNPSSSCCSDTCWCILREHGQLPSLSPCCPRLHSAFAACRGSHYSKSLRSATTYCSCAHAGKGAAAGRSKLTPKGESDEAAATIVDAEGAAPAGDVAAQAISKGASPVAADAGSGKKPAAATDYRLPKGKWAKKGKKKRSRK